MKSAQGEDERDKELIVYFDRNTHVKGKYRTGITEEQRKVWTRITNFIAPLLNSNCPVTFSEIVQMHRKYQDEEDDDAYTISELLRGLADLIDSTLVTCSISKRS